jgi:uncharacterized protein (DUF2252 family)
MIPRPLDRLTHYNLDAKCAGWLQLCAPAGTTRVEVLDAACWMKGCSSLARLRFAVLLGVGKSQAKQGGLCLIDIKEAV